ncbi:hypothetical protein JB92DRAFT_2835300 [Gautieria morchelliformis]|nr:hypothetical protein JB92DRAFT_2835300 [Gautieria morchelliformis]
MEGAGEGTRTANEKQSGRAVRSARELDAAHIRCAACRGVSGVMWACELCEHSEACAGHGCGGVGSMTVGAAARATVEGLQPPQGMHWSAAMAGHAPVSVLPGPTQAAAWHIHMACMCLGSTDKWNPTWEAACIEAPQCWHKGAGSPEAALQLWHKQHPRNSSAIPSAANDDVGWLCMQGNVSSHGIERAERWAWVHRRGRWEVTLLGRSPGGSRTWFVLKHEAWFVRQTGHGVEGNNGTRQGRGRHATAMTHGGSVISPTCLCNLHCHAPSKTATLACGGLRHTAGDAVQHGHAVSTRSEHSHPSHAVLKGGMTEACSAGHSHTRTSMAVWTCVEHTQGLPHSAHITQAVYQLCAGFAVLRDSGGALRTGEAARQRDKRGGSPPSQNAPRHGGSTLSTGTCMSTWPGAQHHCWHRLAREVLEGRSGGTLGQVVVWHVRGWRRVRTSALWMGEDRGKGARGEVWGIPAIVNSGIPTLYPLTSPPPSLTALSAFRGRAFLDGGTAEAGDSGSMSESMRAHMGGLDAGHSGLHARQCHACRQAWLESRGRVRYARSCELSRQAWAGFYHAVVPPKWHIVTASHRVNVSHAGPVECMP